MTTVPFTDARALHQQHPAKFNVPGDDGLEAIQPNDFVAVCAAGERFWVEVMQINGADITGCVANVLMSTAIHGLRCGDDVTVERRHVYEVHATTDRETA